MVIKDERKVYARTYLAKIDKLKRELADAELELAYHLGMNYSAARLVKLDYSKIRNELR